MEPSACPATKDVDRIRVENPHRRVERLLFRLIHPRVPEGVVEEGDEPEQLRRLRRDPAVVLQHREEMLAPGIGDGHCGLGVIGQTPEHGLLGVDDGGGE